MKKSILFVAFILLVVGMVSGADYLETFDNVPSSQNLPVCDSTQLEWAGVSGTVYSCNRNTTELHNWTIESFTNPLDSSTGLKMYTNPLFSAGTPNATGYATNRSTSIGDFEPDSRIEVECGYNDGNDLFLLMFTDVGVRDIQLIEATVSGGCQLDDINGSFCPNVAEETMSGFSFSVSELASISGCPDLAGETLENVQLRYIAGSSDTPGSTSVRVDNLYFYNLTSASSPITGYVGVYGFDDFVEKSVNISLNFGVVFLYSTMIIVPLVLLLVAKGMLRKIS